MRAAEAKTRLLAQHTREKQLISTILMSDAGFVASNRPHNLFVQRFLSVTENVCPTFTRLGSKYQGPDGTGMHSSGIGSGSIGMVPTTWVPLKSWIYSGADLSVASESSVHEKSAVSRPLTSGPATAVVTVVAGGGGSPNDVVEVVISVHVEPKSIGK
jgi:hypothetical protein